MGILGGFSGREVINCLEKSFGFDVIGRKGSHVKLSPLASNGKITVIVPDHKQLAPGTLRSIIRQCDISVKEFLDHI